MTLLGLLDLSEKTAAGFDLDFPAASDLVEIVRMMECFSGWPLDRTTMQDVLRFAGGSA